MYLHGSQSWVVVSGFGKPSAASRSRPDAAAVFDKRTIRRRIRWVGFALLVGGGFTIGAWGADLEDSPWAVLVALGLVAGLALVGSLDGGFGRVGEEVMPGAVPGVKSRASRVPPRARGSFLTELAIDDGPGPDASGEA